MIPLFQEQKARRRLVLQKPSLRHLKRTHLEWRLLPRIFFFFLVGPKLILWTVSTNKGEMLCEVEKVRIITTVVLR